MNIIKFFYVLIICPILTYGFNRFNNLIGSNNLLGSWIIKKSSSNSINTIDSSIFKKDTCIDFEYDQKIIIKQPLIFGLNKIYSGTYHKNPFINNFHIKINKLDYSIYDLVISQSYTSIPIINYNYQTTGSNIPYIIHEESNKINNTIFYIEKFNIRKPNTELIICHFMIVSNIILTSYLIYLYFNLLSLIYRNIMHN